jgi:hypothetical protein
MKDENRIVLVAVNIEPNQLITCLGCYFFIDNQCINENIYCLSVERKDNKSVIWVEQ